MSQANRNKNQFSSCSLMFLFFGFRKRFGVQDVESVREREKLCENKNARIEDTHNRGTYNSSAGLQFD